jgi:hypothetical protein
MNKNSLLTILLISAICLFVNAVAGCILLNLGGVASVVLSIIFVVNCRKAFGAEAEDARMSCLINAIVNGAIYLAGTSVGIILAIVTLGIFSLLSGGIGFATSLGFGIWQIVLWNKLKNQPQGAAAAV